MHLRSDSPRLRLRNSRRHITPTPVLLRNYARETYPVPRIRCLCQGVLIRYQVDVSRVLVK